MPGSTNGADDAVVVSLEKKYIALLEQKIAQLEQRLAAQDETTKESEQTAAAKRRMSTVGEKEKTPQEPDSDAAVKTEKGDKTDAPPEAENKTAEPEDLVEENPRVRLLDSRYDEKTGIFEEVPSRLPVKVKVQGPQLPYAFTWLRKFNESSRYSTTRVTVNSVPLEELIRENCRASSDSNFKQFMPQFRVLVWNWDSLQKATEDHAGDDDEKKQARQDLRFLLDKVQSSPEMEKYFEARGMWKENGEISFDYLWTLFPPGEMVCSKVFMNDMQAFIAREGDVEKQAMINGQTKSVFELTCWSYDWNGDSFNRVGGSLKIENFSGTKTINTLNCYPISYYVNQKGNPDESGLRAKLKERGEKFRKFCTMPKGSQMFNCNGPILGKQVGLGDMGASSIYTSDAASTIGSEPADYVGPDSMKVRGSVIVDHKSYLEIAPGGNRSMGGFAISDDTYECRCSVCMKSKELKSLLKLDYDDVKGDKPFWEDDQYIICPARFLGYVLSSKSWAQMPVTCVEEIKHKIRQSAFDNLILENDAKTLVKCLVANHEKKKSSGDGDESGNKEDWIEGKGRGLVILLHGPPGVGKTSTAESVAQATGKPLFSVSVSDIGLKPDEVENKLAKIFNLAARWEAVLLFDEADVFLESRGYDKGDLNRNSLVTVFLRILEYYDGILILTTNRIRSFDIAVQSRVHLAIRYNDLSVDQLRQLFLKFIKRHADEVHDMKRIETWIKEDFDQDVDGRQIRNIVSAARAMARSEDNEEGKVRLQDIRAVLKMTSLFQKHLRDQRAAAKRDQVVGDGKTV